LQFVVAVVVAVQCNIAFVAGTGFLARINVTSAAQNAALIMTFGIVVFTIDCDGRTGGVVHFVCNVINRQLICIKYFAYHIIYFTRPCRFFLVCLYKPSSLFCRFLSA